MEALLLKGSFTSALGTHLLGAWPNKALTYLWVPMELSGTLEGSLQIKNNIEAPTLVYVQGYVQDGFGRF